MRMAAFLPVVLVTSLLGGLLAWHGAGSEPALAEPIDIESLPEDQKAYRKAVEKYLDRVDSLIVKLKANKDKLDLPFGKKPIPVILELQSLRDITKRELEKFDFTEHGGFSASDVRTYVNGALRTLNDKYERASDYLG